MKSDKPKSQGWSTDIGSGAQCDVIDQLSGLCMNVALCFDAVQIAHQESPCHYDASLHHVT